MVVDSKSQRKADRVFHALADTTRRDILARTMRGENSVSTLASCYPMSFAAVQKHVAVLERAELVTKQRRGREQLVRGNTAAIEYAMKLLERFEHEWRERLDRFDEVLSDSIRKGTTS
ncbi:MAG: metalloregulator ArsR/SmtB family transcription factor [Acidimicrobiales bacterium]